MSETYERAWDIIEHLPDDELKDKIYHLAYTLDYASNLFTDELKDAIKKELTMEIDYIDEHMKLVKRVEVVPAVENVYYRYEEKDDA